MFFFIVDYVVVNDTKPVSRGTLSLLELSFGKRVERMRIKKLWHSSEPIQIPLKTLAVHGSRYEDQESFPQVLVRS